VHRDPLSPRSVRETEEVAPGIMFAFDRGEVSDIVILFVSCHTTNKEAARFKPGPPPRAVNGNSVPVWVVIAR
jgi:hypothetical protein